MGIITYPERVVFYEISAAGEKWTPLPERLIMRAKEDSEKIQSTISSETFANNQPSETCNHCHMNFEDCGLMITRSMKEDTKEDGVEERGTKRKMTTESCEGMGFSCNLKKMKTLLSDKDVLKITDEAFKQERAIVAESKIATRGGQGISNLFDAKRTHLMGDTPMSQKLYHKVLRKRASLPHPASQILMQDEEETHQLGRS